MTHTAWVGQQLDAGGTGWRAVLVSGDSTGRVFLTAMVSHEGALTSCAPTRLDKCHGLADADVGVAATHKFHPIVSVDASPFDPTLFLVASANGRVSVWRCQWQDLPSGPDPGPEGVLGSDAVVSLELQTALVTNYAVENLLPPWLPLVAPGASSDLPTQAVFSPVSPNVVVCSGGTLPSESNPMSVFFCSLSPCSVIQKCLFPQPITCLSRVVAGDAGAFVGVGTTEGQVYMLSCDAPPLLGQPVMLVPSAGDGVVRGVVAVAKADAARVRIVTTGETSMHVWAFTDEESEERGAGGVSD